MTRRSSGDPADVFTPGSGNVFADLGLPHPEEELARLILLMPSPTRLRNAASHRPRQEHCWGSVNPRSRGS